MLQYGFRLVYSVILGVVLLGVKVNGNASASTGSFAGASESFQALQSVSPQAAGGTVSSSLGVVVLETVSPVTINLENSTNIYIQARNTGSDTVTIQAPLARDIVVPSWVQHFFELNPFPTKIAPGGTATFEYMLAPGRPGSGSLRFSFKLVETGETAGVEIQVSHAPLQTPLSFNATIEGRVTTADGTPLANQEVTAYMLINPANDFRGRTDAQGRYAIPVPSVEEIQQALGNRPLPYQSLGYAVTVAPDGYSLGFRGGIEPATNSTVTVDFTLDKVTVRQYNLIGESRTGTPHGYFWLFPDGNFERFYAVQGRHPPELRLPGHIIAVDRTGQELWRVQTGDECWGFDVSSKGDIAAGSHDRNVYLVGSDGNVRWQLDSGNMNRTVRFHPDGGSVLTGPFGNADAALLDVNSGQVLWSYKLAGERRWLRHARWGEDGERVVAGFSGGLIIMLTRSGAPLWQTSIGEFPMVLEIDRDYNTYLAGKSRELFSFDANGQLRWRRRVGSGVISASSNSLSNDGNRIVIGTVGGWVEAYDGLGNLLWQRRLPGTSLGHNALDITPDGNFIAVGVVGEPGRDGYLLLFDRNGSLLWQVRYPDLRDTGEIAYTYSYEHNHRGVITVAVSDDGQYIVAGFGDGTIRIFEVQNESASSQQPPMRLGINFPFSGLETASLSTYLSLLSQSGAPAMRYLIFSDVYWGNVEPTDNAWNFVYPDSSINNSYGILAIPMLYGPAGDRDTVGLQVPWIACNDPGCGWQTARDSTAAKDYVQTVVQRYQSRVKYWEISNELAGHPDRPLGLPMHELVEFMHLNYRWIKEVDPEAQVLQPGLLGTYGLPMGNSVDWLRRFLESGGAGSFDILSYHDYNSWWTLPVHYDSLKALLTQYGLDAVPLWCTESSISSDPSTDITPPYSSIDEQAADVWRRPAVLFAKGLEVYFWHSMWSSGGSSSWREFGILSAAGEKKKSFFSYQLLTEKLEGFASARALSFGEVTDDNTTGGDGVWVVQFDWPDGTRRWVAWSPDNQTYTLNHINATQIKVTTVVPVSISDDGERATFEVQTLSSIGGSALLQLSGFPVLIEEERTTAVDNTGQPLSFELAQNYPNPFNPATSIRFLLPKAEFVTLKVYDVLGREVATLINEKLAAGEHMVIFEGKNLNSGIYFYKLTAGPFQQVRKMTLAK
ncbi:MAG: PQQ-binding-like beta-propeller repeat protein [candidate division KSB1 bacterium]|nr:PQQ-binding-like beta-propeller repeat protein [candidate division KSB1 bacterium]